MNRFAAAIILTVLAVSTCIMGKVFVNSGCKEVDRLLGSAYESARQGDLQTAREKAEEAEQAFVDNEDIISAFVHRQLTRDVGVLLSKLKSLAYEDSKEEFMAECKAAKIMLTHIMKGETVDISNIF